MVTAGRLMLWLKNFTPPIVNIMHHKVKICTFNCHSFITNIEIVRELCDEYDIILLQETFLIDIGKIEENIGRNFSYHFTPAEIQYSSGRPKGGLLILWRSYLDNCIERVTCPNKRISGIKLLSESDKYLILNVYAPFENNTIDSYNLYIEFLTCLSDTIDSNYVPNVLIAGDFNSDPKGGRFWNELNAFSNDLDFNIADLTLESNTFTFLSPAHNSTSWLDHVIESRQGLTSDICVLYDSVLYDHFPMVFNIEFQMNSPTRSLRPDHIPDSNDSFIPWARMTDNDKQRYMMNTENNFQPNIWQLFF